MSNPAGVPDGTASYEVSTIKFELGPIRDELTREFNEYHGARRNEDTETMRLLDGLVPKVLNEYDRSESRRALNPLWRRRMMRAGWYHCRGEYDLALEYEKEGWIYSQDPPPGVHPDTAARMQSISASNIADELIRLGQSEEASRLLFLTERGR